MAGTKPPSIPVNQSDVDSWSFCLRKITAELVVQVKFHKICLSRDGRERQVCPLSRLSPSHLALISCANAVKVSYEPIPTDTRVQANGLTGSCAMFG